MGCCIFLKMTFHSCLSGCGCYLAPADGRDRCLMCLGSKHAEVAFVDESFVDEYSPREDDHLGVAIKTPLPQKRWSSLASASI